MPRLEKAMKDVVWLRKASGRCQAIFDPEISEWGNLVCEEHIVSELDSDYAHLGK